MCARGSNGGGGGDCGDGDVVVGGDGEHATHMFHITITHAATNHHLFTISSPLLSAPTHHDHHLGCFYEDQYFRVVRLEEARDCSNIRSGEGRGRCGRDFFRTFIK
jgi:hypothetical protein